MVLEATAAVPGETTSRVGFTGPAVALLQELWEQHGPLMFHQSGGCCDGSSPMCFPAGEFRTGAADVLLGTARLPSASGGELGDLEFWISAEQFEYWRHTRLVIDAVPGRGGGFSLEAPTGRRFLTRSELCGI
ncbi:UDP-glucose 4-epimerase [Kocuria marina]|uniref:UDP-glucose 4-epimerase n=1 Tax=Kocuria marina TaxID=223184 RepID=A0A0B0DEJ6_9MICC|nr:UDP-glucose 4-epimerase [Kocuria marina]